jgi:hypothetical protein
MKEGIECDVLLKNNVGEKEGDFDGKLKNDKKKDKVMFKEGKVLNVKEILIKEKEKNMIKKEKNEKKNDKNDISNKGVEIMYEVVKEKSVKEII